MCSRRRGLAEIEDGIVSEGGTGQSFEYLAHMITITDDKITVSQDKSTASLDPVPIPKERRCKPDSPLTPEEKTEFRSLNGSLSWLAQQTRPDIAVAVNRSAQRVEKATIQDFMQANAIARQILKTLDRCIVIRRGVFDPENLALVSFGDASFASAEDEKSQAGEVLLATRPGHTEDPRRSLR